MSQFLGAATRPAAPCSTFMRTSRSLSPFSLGGLRGNKSQRTRSCARAKWLCVERVNSPAHLHLGEEAGNAAAAAAVAAAAFCGGGLAHDRNRTNDGCVCVREWFGFEAAVGGGGGIGFALVAAAGATKGSSRYKGGHGEALGVGGRLQIAKG